MRARLVRSRRIVPWRFGVPKELSFTAEIMSSGAESFTFGTDVKTDVSVDDFHRESLHRSGLPDFIPRLD